MCIRDRHVGCQHLNAVAYYLIVVDKQADNRFPQEKIEEGGQGSHHQAAFFRKPFHLAEALSIAGAVIIA